MLEAPGSGQGFSVARLNDMTLPLTTAVERLDARSKRLIALRYEDELTIREIGDLLALQPNAVEVALHRARARIRRQLEPAA